MHSFFIDAYRVPPSFEFGLYLCESLDMQIVELVEVDVQSWFFMIVAILLNLVRVEVKKAIYPSSDDVDESSGAATDDHDDHDDDDHHRMLFSDLVHRVLGGSGPAAECDLPSTSNATTSDYEASPTHRLLGGGGAADGCEVKTGTVYTFIIFGFMLSLFSFVIFYEARKR